MKTFITVQDSSAMLRDVLENPNSNIEEIGESVKNNPKMSAFVLKIANSPLVGLEEKVDDIGWAINLLGIGQVCELLLDELAIAPLKASVKSPKITNPMFSYFNVGLGLKMLATI
ncbi:MAG: HDOD domain-containing protein [Methyloglobulus sp.]|nr:HDOD domain-containing protein [Methyloglobulus sp.]